MGGPDNEQSAQTRILKKIIAEREKRAAELLEIQHQRQELGVENQNIAQLRYNIDQQKKALEARVFAVEDFHLTIPSAKYLKDIGIGFDQALAWIDCIREKADKERIDLRTAAWKFAQDLRLYSELGGLSKAIREAPCFRNITIDFYRIWNTNRSL